MIYVTRQLGHGAQLTTSTYGHVIEELKDAPRPSSLFAAWAMRRGEMRSVGDWHVPRTALPVAEPRLPAGSGRFGDVVADSGGGVDDVGLAEFASESGDGDLDGVGEWVDVLVPGLLEETLCAKRAGAGCE